MDHKILKFASKTVNIILDLIAVVNEFRFSFHKIRKEAREYLLVLILTLSLFAFCFIVRCSNVFMKVISVIITTE